MLAQNGPEGALPTEGPSLSAPEHRYQKLVEHTYDGIVLMNARGLIVDFNPAAERMFGYRREEVLSQPLIRLMPEPYRSAHLKGVARFLATGEGQAQGKVLQFDALKKDGTEFPIELTVSSYRVGTELFFTGILRDVTEQKRAQDELRASEERYRLLAENVADVIWVWDMNLRPTYYSPSVARLRGYSVEEAMTHTIDQMLTPASRDTALKALASALSQEGERGSDRSRPRTLRLEVTRKDGSTVWTETTMTFLRYANNEPAGILGVTRDITARRRAQEVLRESEQRFRGAFEGSSVGMALQGLGGQYLRVNRALCTMLGYTEPELLSTRYQAITHPDDIGTDATSNREMLEGRIGSYEAEKRYVHKDGHIVWALATISLVRDSDARPVYFVVQTQDITERKRAAEAEIQLKEQLRQAQKMEAIGRLAGGVAHDFHNLLTVVRGRAVMLRQHLDSEHPIVRHIVIIEHTVDRASRLIQQLLAFSRKQVLRPSVLDLNEIIANTGDLLRRVLGEHITLVAERGPGLGGVLADPTQLEQVIVNLAVNARDAMPEGGRLVFRTRNVDLDEVAIGDWPELRPGRYVMLQVMDTGHGMDAATQAHIFEPFFTTKELGKGTGLGLATVYGIIKQSGGGIYVESEVGRGTTFTIYLPHVEGVVELQAAEAAAPAALSGTETILLVEDDDEVRELTREILEAQGYRVLAVSQPVRALRTAESHQEPIHLLLTDVVMPNMSGRALADQMVGRWPHLKVLYMSGYADEVIGHHGVLDPDRNLIPKPFTPEALARRVRAVLNT
jgi:PAS domain S-box-containing protein